MRASIIFPDKMIGLGGVFYNIPTLIAPDPNYSVIQWYDDGHGTIEVYMGDRIWFTDESIVQPYIDAWNQANSASATSS